MDACSPAQKQMANPGTLLPFLLFVNIPIKKQVILPVLIEPLRLSPLGAPEWDLSESSPLSFCMLARTMARWYNRF